MSRQKISEYKAKALLFPLLDLPYHGIHVAAPDIAHISLDANKSYVVKVDEGVKKRFKQGLVKLEITAEDVPAALEEFAQKGYTQFLVEEYVPHNKDDERYLSLQRTREGIIVFASKQGGIEIEEQHDAVKQFILPEQSSEDVASFLGVDAAFITKLVTALDKYHISFLEINPLVVADSTIFLLDLAVMVDSAGEFFAEQSWSEGDFIEAGTTKLTEEEQAVKALSNKSQASFKLNVLNRDGAIFMLLSGGGASVVAADEVYNQGFGHELANYGEYSGNPNAEETYLYTKQVLNLLLTSSAPKKVLVIAGGVANFTDIRVTFKGIIQAVTEVADKLREQQIKVYVRRGGPHEEEGLAQMKRFLDQESLLGNVVGPEMVLTDIVKEAVQSVELRAKS
jgi:succinyl-CoA synthetase beta subunit